jgi:hypothetical protein
MPTACPKTKILSGITACGRQISATGKSSNRTRLPGVSDRDGSLVAVDENGNEAGRIDWSGEYGMWQSLGWLSLPPGRYTLRFEDEESDWRHFVLLAADVPLPPGVEVNRP